MLVKPVTTDFQKPLVEYRTVARLQTKISWGTMHDRPLVLAIPSPGRFLSNGILFLFYCIST